MLCGCGKTNRQPDEPLPSSSQESSISASAESTAAKPEATVTDSPAHDAAETPTITPTPTVDPSEMTETPEPVPEAPHGEPDINLIRAQTESLIGTYEGEWSVYFKRLDTGESFCINDMPMVAASLIKLYVYGAAWELIEQGLLSEDEYSGYLWDMIAYSDNDSCNILIDAVGGLEPVNEFIIRNGYSASQLNRRMLDWNGMENYTSAADCGRLLETALSGTYVSQHASAFLQSAMIGGSNTWKIRAGVPEGITAGNKTGELDGVENDTAFVFSPACTYILCVMTSGVDAGRAHGNIAELSAHIYSLLNG